MSCLKVSAIRFSRRFRKSPSLAKRVFHRGMAVDSNSSPSEWSGPIYHPNERVENLQSYCEGGYHPIRLGDEFSRGRYRVIHKLGYGSFSTVWLARDDIGKRYVSLKVVMAAASKSNLEAKIMDHLHRGDVDHPGRNFISFVSDEFWIDGPNGRHQCLVSEVVGSTISVAKEVAKYDMLPLEVARAITPQLALGLDYIHSHGVLHGDLHSGNIAFKLPNMDAWPIERIHEHFAEPWTEMVSRCDHQPLGPEVPPYTVVPGYFLTPDERGLRKQISSDKTSLREQIKILDFGEASFSNEHRMELNTPVAFRSPEAFFNESIGFPADIWAFACTIFAIFGQRPLFESFMRCKDDVLVDMVTTLGMLPDQWWTNWEARRYYLLDDGSMNPNTMVTGEEIEPLALRIQTMRHRRRDLLVEGVGQLNAEDLAGLQNLLASSMRYEPSERLTVEEIVKSEWMQHLLLENKKSE